MCGIAGIVGRRRGVARLQDEALRRMTVRLAHRGPDGDGHWTSTCGRVGFGHRRLAIVDLAPDAAQPMRNEDGRVWVTFNGEIYNHAALRRELAACGHHFATDHSDTEVLLHGYEEWGVEGLAQRLDGIFAFAIHDETRDVTHLVRDHVGVKPLYVSWTADALLFASEIKGVLAHGARAPVIEAASVPLYLTFMMPPAPATMVKGVFKLPPAHLLTLDASARGRLARYWHPARGLEPRPHAETVARLRAEIERSIESQLVADVPVGVLLSGGLDSTAILSVATRKLGGGVDAFSVSFPGAPQLDEISDAARSAQVYGAQHRVVPLDEATGLAILDDMIEAQDEPNADWVCLPVYLASRLAHEAGYKVAMVGEGADEQFVGYEHYLTYLDRIAGLFDLVRRVPGVLAPVVASAAGAWAGDDMRKRLRLSFLKRALAGGEAFWGGAVLAWPELLPLLVGRRETAFGEAPEWEAGPDTLGALASDPHALVAGWYASVDRAGGGADPVNRMAAYEFLHRLPELLLMRVDKMTMAHALEARVPFLAPSLVELSMSLPGAIKRGAGGTKALYRDALRGLVPEDIRALRKRGFGAPIAAWLKGPLGERVRAELHASPLVASGLLSAAAIDRLDAEHRAGAADHAGFLWAMFCLAVWARRVGATLQ